MMTLMPRAAQAAIPVCKLAQLLVTICFSGPGGEVERPRQGCTPGRPKRF